MITFHANALISRVLLPSTLFVPIFGHRYTLRHYRTVSGMMNYSMAIKLLYRVENPEIVQQYGGSTERLEQELERMSRRKFTFVVSMKWYPKFNREAHEKAEFLLRAYPDLQIASLEEEPPRKVGGDPRLFSVLIDGHPEFIPETGRRKAKFRIELPGNPILGDGIRITKTTLSSFIGVNIFNSSMPSGPLPRGVSQDSQRTWRIRGILIVGSESVFGVWSHGIQEASSRYCECSQIHLLREHWCS